MLKRLGLAIFLSLGAANAYAVEPDEILPDAKLEARARTLSAELRCMVCQNESIDDSHAELARDLRNLVREHLKAGQTDADIKAYLVQRYGDFILLKPPFKFTTLGLWGTPLIVLLAGACAIYLNRGKAEARFKTATSEPPLSQAEELKLAELLKSPE
jgi:cytochrome c-type biogenesis protein CcmH